MDELTPKGKERYQKFLEKATEVFLEQGFENASMSEIVKRAGGSLATLYKIFENKEQLFRAIVEDKMAKVFSSMSDVSDDEDIEVFLNIFGLKMFDLSITDEAMDFYVLIIKEGHRNNYQVANILKEYSDKCMRSILIKRLINGIEDKIIFCDDVDIVADQFVCMIQEPLYFKRLLGENIENYIKNKEKYISKIVKLFLYGIKQE